jgi:hypothetical protein
MRPFNMGALHLKFASAAKEGQITEVSYNSPKLGASTEWVPKVSLVTAVAGLGCGVGYYK